MMEDAIAAREQEEPILRSELVRSTLVPVDVVFHPSFASDLRFQWLYTDAVTAADDKFVIDIFGVVRNDKVQARFLDDTAPTSSRVSCSIQDSSIMGG